MYRHRKMKWLNKELLAYGIVGMITTGINILLYDLLCNKLGIANLLANAAAWAGSVLFAFAANDRVVFPEKNNQKSFRERLLGFIGARLLSLIVDEAGMFLFVDCLALPKLFSKLVWNAVVIIMNYILSKKYIFR